MKKNVLYAFLATGLLIGILATWQFQNDVPVGSNFAVDEIEARKSLLKEFLDEQAYLQSRIVTLRKEIEDSQKSINAQTEKTNLEVLGKLKEDIGLTEAIGRGVEITLDDSPFALREGTNVTDEQLVQASDLRDVVNILSAADATAISINNQRVIATSPISSVGTTILVNNAYIAPPFIITAVGDTEIILQRLLNEKLLPSIYDRSAKTKLVFKIAMKEFLKIPIYNGDLNVDYLNLVE